MSSRDTKTSTSEEVPFLEEWKAKRERMRLKSSSSSGALAIEARSPDPCLSKEFTSPVSPKHHQTHGQDLVRKSSYKVLDTGQVSRKAAEPHQAGNFSGGKDSMENESQALHGKDKRVSGQRKTRTQIEKRKLREKRRPTGVVNISLESLEDDEPVQEISTVDHREAGTSRRAQDNQDPVRAPYIRQKSGSGGSVHVSLSRKPSGNQPKYMSLQDKEPYGGTKNDLGAAQLERKMKELQQAVTGEKTENQKLNHQLKDQEDAIQKLKLQISSLRKVLHGAEDENRQLREEHQTLLRVVGQLSG